MSKVNVSFHDTKYRASHGKAPKGFGGWMFIVMDGDREHEIVSAGGGQTLAQAKKWMRDYVREHYAFIADDVEVEIAP